MSDLFSKILADALAPGLARWSHSREKQILRSGAPLPPEMLCFAEELGISRPDTLRLELTDTIPFPVPDQLIKWGGKFGLPVFRPAGMCLGRGLAVVSEDPAILRHELVHTLQYQKLGGHFEFMHRYVQECAAFGYTDAPLEIEARKRSISASLPIDR